MKLIVLSGPGSCGKTTSLLNLANRIETSGNVIPKEIVKLNDKDFEYVFYINTHEKEVKLVIHTQGDYYWSLPKCCEKYKDFDIVICACNMKFMRGKAHKPFETAMLFDPLATVVMKSKEPEESRQNDANSQCSDYLFGLVKYFGII